MICFEQRYRNSFGLGSGHGLLSKDCGYQVDLDKFTDFGYGPLGQPPFRNIRRHRAMNNYLVWAAFGWGHWLRPAQEAYFAQAVTHEKERFNLTGVQANVAAQERAYQQRLTDRQRYAQNMAARGEAILLLCCGSLL